MDDTTPQNQGTVPADQAGTATVSRRTFSALAGAGMALLLPRVAHGGEAAEAQAPAPRSPGSVRPSAAASPAMIHTFRPPRPAKDLDNAIVYRREDEFASHPYVAGFWETAAGHLVANFSTRKVNYVGDPNDLSHNNLGRNPGGRQVNVRSEDRGRTWKEANPTFNDGRGRQAAADDEVDSLAEIGPIDFRNKDVLVANSSSAFGAPTSRSVVRISKDGGHTWSRSFRLPLDGLHSLSAINSSLVRPDGRCLLFMFEVSPDGWNRHNLVYRSTDDHSSFHFLSFITPKDDPFAAGTGDWKGPFASADIAGSIRAGYMLPNGTDAVRAALSARSDRGHVDRALQERRRRAHVGVSLARQRFRRAGQPRADERRAPGDGLRLPVAAFRHSRRGQRRRRPDLGLRDHPARRWRQLGSRLSQRLGSGARQGRRALLLQQQE